MKDFLLGWNENNWQNAFLAVLLPAMAVALLASSALPSLRLFFIGLAVVGSLFWAVAKDGPEGRLGIYVWLFLALCSTVTIFALLIILPEASPSIQFRFAGHGFRIMVESEESECVSVNPPDRLHRRGFRQRVIWT